MNLIASLLASLSPSEIVFKWRQTTNDRIKMDIADKESIRQAHLEMLRINHSFVEVLLKQGLQLHQAIKTVRMLSES